MSDLQKQRRHARSGFSARLLTSVMLVVAVLAALITPAGSGLASDEVQLRASRTELRDAVGKHNVAIDRLGSERSEVLLDIATLTAAIDGNADAIATLNNARRLHADRKIEAALTAFTGGGSPSASFSAGANLDALDLDIRTLQAGDPQRIAERTTEAERLDIIDAAVLELRVKLRLAEADLAEVDAHLAWYADTASRSPITGRANPFGNQRAALVVKIDNVPRARPQAAINQADLVFVEMVEGGQTRLAATFHSTEPATIGPVRSMRTTDVALVKMFDKPLFANSGANARTTQIVNASPLVNIGAATSSGGAYYRNNSRPVPHNLFSSTNALRRAGGDRGGVPPKIFTIRRPGTDLPNASTASNGVDISYPNTSVGYRWNGSGWARSQDGRAFNDINGVRVAPETVIVRFTPYGVSPADATSPEARVSGNGVAWIFTEGVLITGTWTKSNANVPTVYRDSNGDELNILPGRVWIELPTPNSGTLR